LKTRSTAVVVGVEGPLIGFVLTVADWKRAFFVSFLVAAVAA